MAKARKFVNSTPNAEVDQLRRTVNALLMMLETASASITAGATAEQVLSAWAAGVAAGIDSNPAATANIVASNAPLVGVRVNPVLPKGPGTSDGTLSVSDDT